MKLIQVCCYTYAAVSQGAIDLVRTQPGREGGQDLVINFFTLLGGGAKNLLNQWPPICFSNSDDLRDSLYVGKYVPRNN